MSNRVDVRISLDPNKVEPSLMVFTDVTQLYYDDHFVEVDTVENGVRLKYIVPTRLVVQIRETTYYDKEMDENLNQ